MSGDAPDSQHQVGVLIGGVVCMAGGWCSGLLAPGVLIRRVVWQVGCVVDS